MRIKSVDMSVPFVFCYFATKYQVRWSIACWDVDSINIRLFKFGSRVSGVICDPSVLRKEGSDQGWMDNRSVIKMRTSYLFSLGKVAIARKEGRARRV